MGMDATTVARWEERFEQLTDAIGPCFKRQDLRRQAIAYLQGLRGRVERKNSWQLSEYLGREGPYDLQRLLGRARARCDEAGVPEGVTFATKPQLARKMLQRAFQAGCQPAFVLADEVYGNDSKFRRFLESCERSYVLAVSCQQRLWVDFRQKRVDEIARSTPAQAWQRLSVGEGAKGPLVYDWATARFGRPTASSLIHWLLIRRSVTDPDDLAYYLCLTPQSATVSDLAYAAGQRWAIETCFECAKQETGLDEYEVRSWVGWYRHVTLSLLALAFLTAVRAEANQPRRGSRPKKGRI